MHCLLNVTLLHSPLPSQCSSLNTGHSQHCQGSDHHAVAVHRKSTPWGLSQFLSPVPLDRQLSLSSRSLFQPPCSHIRLQYSTCTNGAALLQPLFHTCTDINALWWSPFRHHCNSGWLRRQAELNLGPLTWQASTLPVHQRGNLVGKASRCTACSTSLCYTGKTHVCAPTNIGKWSKG